MAAHQMANRRPMDPPTTWQYSDIDTLTIRPIWRHRPSPNTLTARQLNIRDKTSYRARYFDKRAIGSQCFVSASGTVGEGHGMYFPLSLQPTTKPPCFCGWTVQPDLNCISAVPLATGTCTEPVQPTSIKDSGWKTNMARPRAASRGDPETSRHGRGQTE